MFRLPLFRLFACVIGEGVATRFQGVRDSESRHDSSLILLILQSRFPLNFCKFLVNWLFPAESDWFWVILSDFGWFWLILTSKFMIFPSDYFVILSDSEQGCTKIVLSCDLLGYRYQFWIFYNIFVLLVLDCYSISIATSYLIVLTQKLHWPVDWYDVAAFLQSRQLNTILLENCIVYGRKPLSSIKLAASGCWPLFYFQVFWFFKLTKDKITKWVRETFSPWLNLVK